MACGNALPAALIAACTSCAAESIFRPRSNWIVIEVAPSALNDVIWVTSANWPSWRSSGAATVEAIVSGLAPARVAVTCIVGKSTCGKAATGRSGNAAIPSIASAAATKDVAMGRRSRLSKKFTTPEARSAMFYGG